MAKIEYSFIINNHYSSWDIYQRSDLDLSYQLPNLPTEFLEQTTILKDNIDNPKSLIFHAYKSEDEDLLETYNQESIEYRLSCFDHLIRILGVDF